MRVSVVLLVLSDGEYSILKSSASQQKTSGVPGMDLPGIDLVALEQIAIRRNHMIAWRCSSKQ